MTFSDIAIHKINKMINKSDFDKFDFEGVEGDCRVIISFKCGDSCSINQLGTVTWKKSRLVKNGN